MLAKDAIFTYEDKTIYDIEKYIDTDKTKYLFEFKIYDSFDPIFNLTEMGEDYKNDAFCVAFVKKFNITYNTENNLFDFDDNIDEMEMHKFVFDYYQLPAKIIKIEDWDGNGPSPIGELICKTTKYMTFKEFYDIFVTPFFTQIDALNYLKILEVENL